jgi:hypothetical protein
MDDRTIEWLKIDNEDKYLGSRELRGEGMWYEAYIFETPTGHRYEIWMDPDGAEKLVEL